MNADVSHRNGSFTPDAGNTRALRDAFGCFATGVTVVTALDDAGRVVAITANSFSSVSLDPPLVSWAPSRASRRFRHFEAAQHFAIHVLAADQENLFWRVSQDAYALDADGLPRAPEGTPVLPQCLARFECRQKALYDGGDHVIVLGEVLRAHHGADGDALAFFRGKMGRFSAP